MACLGGLNLFVDCYGCDILVRMQIVLVFGQNKKLNLMPIVVVVIVLAEPIEIISSELGN